MDGMNNKDLKIQLPFSVFHLWLLQDVESANEYIFGYGKIPLVISYFQ